mgnify:FL=1|tara:strand:+ start:402 stop:815 length:414 start_codon:yes stop_codon:yes gene_type:complete
MGWKDILKDMKAPPFVELNGVLYKLNGSKGDDNYYIPVDEIKLYRTGKINRRMPPFQPHHPKSRREKDITDQEVKLSTKEAIKLGEAGEKRKRSLLEKDTFEKEAGGVSFGGHGANPELFNIRYSKKRRDKNGKESK